MVCVIFVLIYRTHLVVNSAFGHLQYHKDWSLRI